MVETAQLARLAVGDNPHSSVKGAIVPRTGVKCVVFRRVEH